MKKAILLLIAAFTMFFCKAQIQPAPHVYVIIPEQTYPIVAKPIMQDDTLKFAKVQYTSDTHDSTEVINVTVSESVDQRRQNQNHPPQKAQFVFNRKNTPFKHYPATTNEILLYVDKNLGIKIIN